MKNYYSFNTVIILFIFSIFFFSCSSDDGGEGGGSSNSPQSITLSSNFTSETASVNEIINFTVKGNDGKDYTSQSTIYLDGEAISGKSHKFTEGGSHSFTAKMDKLTSNVISITVENTGEVAQPDAITLSSNMGSSNVNVNEEVTFQVLGDNGIEYTSLSTIMVNGEPIKGNKHTFNEGGDHEIKAVYENLNSNALNFKVTSSNYITINRNKALKGQEVNFEFFGSDGEKATTNATFFVNGSAISGNTFSTQTTGVYEVIAKTDSGEETEAKGFEVFTPVRKALFEDYTGTWCGWCPRVTNAILLIKEQTNDIVVVAVHYQDDMMKDESEVLVDHFEILRFPHARLNRTHVLEYPEDGEEQLEQVLDVAGTESLYSFAINTTLNNDLLDIEVKMISAVDIPANYKLVVYVLQNGVIFPQENYLNNDSSSRWYQAGYPIPNFVHDEVLEVSLTNVLGDSLGAVSAFEEVTFEYGPVDLSSYVYNTPKNSYNPNNFEVAVFLTKEDNTALNAQHVTAGHSVNFE
ncbi:Omp28-related outer membrane protein [Salinimicrobium flavum]|uniref:Omp28-related outer membrane protein n=1 Tax=Salinimicrobium flavum TaxID=1737065 RepID=A0ABW5ISR7_9FLAO